MKGSGVCRNAQHLARVNFVRVSQHGFVGFKNLRIFVRCAVKLFADFGQVVATHHGVHLGLWLLG